MKILITGNLGYVGPGVIQRIRDSFPDAFLIGYDVGYFAGCISNPDRLPETYLNLQFYADLRRFPEAVLEGVDAVVHLAAISNDPIGNLFEDVTTAINHHAGIELARQAKQFGVKRFVFASSCSMYGTADDTARTEDSQLKPLTAYARSKVTTENDLKRMADDDFLVTSLRFSTACGWSDRLRLDLVLNDFVACAVTSGEITILSDGTPWRPLINVKDMGRAIEWAATRDDKNGGAFLAVNVGSDEWNYQVKDLAEAVAKVIPNTKISINKDAQPDKRSYKVGFELFRKLAPKHQPQVDLIESIRELKEGLERIRFNNADFRNSDFMRLKHLTRLQKLGLINDKLQWVKAQ